MDLAHDFYSFTAFTIRNMIRDMDVFPVRFWAWSFCSHSVLIQFIRVSSHLWMVIKDEPFLMPKFLLLVDKWQKLAHKGKIPRSISIGLNRSCQHRWLRSMQVVGAASVWHKAIPKRNDTQYTETRTMRN